MQPIKVENLYDTTLTESTGIAASGDVDFTLGEAPEHTNGWIVVDSDNLAKRELMFYHDAIGNRVYVRGVNRNSPQPHSSGVAVKMLDVAEIFNYFSDMISQAFYVEKTGGLTVKISGGYTNYNGAMISIADKSLTLTDNTTNYITYEYTTNTISSNTTGLGNVKAVVTVLAGIITNISYRTAKESFIDFTVSLTGALPSQSGHAGHVFWTDGTTAYWAAPEHIKATSSVQGEVEIPTDIEMQTMSSTGGTTAPLAVTPLLLGNLYSKGDGSDGDVVISTNTSLTRDMYYNDLTVNTGINLDPAGFAIFVKGTLTLSGTAKIVRNGNNGGTGGTAASGFPGTAGAGGAALASGTCGASLGGSNGGAGSFTGVGTAGVAGVAVNPSFGTGSSGAGGAGGNGGAAGGAGGAAAVATQGPYYNRVLSLAKALALIMYPARGISDISAYGGMSSAGGGGGGSGAGAGSGGGGGGGAGGNGGNIFVCANSIVGTGTIESKGGNGGNGGGGLGSTTGGGGGGAGGCGGIVTLVYKSGTPYTITLTGGTAGTGGAGNAGGSNGAAGATGTTGQSIIINV